MPVPRSQMHRATPGPLSNALRSSRESPRALLSAVAAFTMWGVLPVYWMLVQRFGSDVVVGQRLVWTMVWLLPLLRWGGEWRAWLNALRSPRLLRIHGWSALLLTVNWSLFIWANQHGRIVEASLGYFLTPLLNVAIGRVLLGEHLSSWRKVSVTLAALGVVLQIVLVGRLPWIALMLAVTFALYGLARKQSPLGSLPGLAVESALVLPFALAGLGWLATRGVPVFGRGDAADVALMVFSGVCTAAPLHRCSPSPMQHGTFPSARWACSSSSRPRASSSWEHSSSANRSPWAR